MPIVQVVLSTTGTAKKQGRIPALFCAIMALALVLAAPGEAYQERFQTLYQYYTDSDGNLERAATLLFQTNYGAYGNTFQVNYSAYSSINVAPDLFWERYIAQKSRRESLGVSGSYYFAPFTAVSYGYTRLASDFFDTDTVTLGASQGFFGNNTIFQVNYTWVSKDYRLGAQQRSLAGLAFYDPLSVGIASGLSLLYTQNLDAKTTFRLGGNYSDETLYPAQWDASLDFRRAFSPQTAVHVLYEYYSNAADIRSNTFRLRGFHYLTDGLLLMVQGRYYFEADYTEEARQYLARIRETNDFVVETGSSNWQAGARLRLNFVDLMPTSKLKNTFEEFNLILQYDYIRIQKEYLGFGDPGSKIDDPNIGRVILVGLDFLFK